MMATTAMWSVKGSIGKLVIYIENPEKTENPQFYRVEDLSDSDRQSLQDVIDYAVSDDKVRKTYNLNSEKSTIESYVTGVSCSSLTAREEMVAVKKQYNKEFGIVAFHGYQSFAENEVTPDIAHEIGIKLAKELWGDRFQVVVATHLDKKNHIHNHFVMNSVSHKDGRKFNLSKQAYRDMRAASDKLCREYGLSVIENPRQGKSKHYAEWKAVKEGKPTWKGLIKEDVDQAIRESMTDRQFFHLLRQKGYLVNVRGKDISVKPEGRGNFFRLKRNFGDNYSKESIDKRILSNLMSNKAPKSKPKYFSNSNVIKRENVKRVGGLRGLYLHYLFKLGILPKRKQSNAQIRFLFKEDLIELDKITSENRYLSEHKIETMEQLNSIKSDLVSNRKLLNQKKRKLNAFIKSGTAGSEDALSSVKAELTQIKRELSGIRKDITLCEGIEERSTIIKEKIAISKEDEQRKEEKANVQSRRRSGTGYENDPTRR